MQRNSFIILLINTYTANTGHANFVSKEQDANRVDISASVSQSLVPRVCPRRVGHEKISTLIVMRYSSNLEATFTH